MMKKYYYIAIPIVLAAVCGCGREQLSFNESEEVIRFDASRSVTQTKATTTEFPKDTDFGVTAFHTNGAASYQYFGNVSVSYDEDDFAWETASTLYWPKAKTGDGTLLEFRGYAPYKSTSPWCSFPDNVTLSGEYDITPGTSPDLMYSTPLAMSPSEPNSVNLCFNHALGQTTFTFGVERFDDSIVKGTYHTGYGDYENIYCVYEEKADPSDDIEEKSFVFLSGNFPYSFDGVADYDPSVQAFDLKNPIQNIWFVEIESIQVHNLAWSGALGMTTDGSAWTKPANSVWTSLSNRSSLELISADDPFYFSPNTKGFGMPLGTYAVIPQDLNPVITSQRPHVSISVAVMLFRAEENAANDGRPGIFDYRDIGQYIDKDGNKVDGDGVKSGVFKKWYSEPATREFPNGITLNFGTAVIRKDATSLFTITKDIDLPLYDAEKAVNPRYLKMNTNTTYSIKIDPAGQEITFTPTIDDWLTQSAQDK